MDARGVPSAVLEDLAAVPGVVRVEALDAETTRIHTNEGAARDVLRMLIDAGVTAVSTNPPSLEEVYLSVFGGRGLRV